MSETVVKVAMGGGAAEVTCPFCGSGIEARRNPSGFWTAGCRRWRTCPAHWTTGWHDTREKAIAAASRRAKVERVANKAARGAELVACVMLVAMSFFIGWLVRERIALDRGLREAPASSGVRR